MTTGSVKLNKPHMIVFPAIKRGRKGGGGGGVVKLESRIWHSITYCPIVYLRNRNFFFICYAGFYVKLFNREAINRFFNVL